ncbi:MAG: PAS domain-containing sensor histidine kinase [Actinomycetota bacterium]
MGNEDRLGDAIDRLERITRTEPAKWNRDHELEHLKAVIVDLEAAGEELGAREEELQESTIRLEHERRRYQEMFHFAPAGYLQTDSKDLITEANLAASRMLRVEQRRLVGKPIVSFVPIADRKVFRIQLALLHDGQELHNRPTRLLPRDSDPLPVLVDVVAARNESGAMTGFRWLIREPTHTPATAPTERARRALDLLEAAPSGCVLVDREWTVRFVNRAACVLMGRTPQDLLGNNLWEAFPELARTSFADIGHVVMANGESLEFEEYFLPWDRWVSGVAFPSEDGVCVFFRDVTKHKEAERAQAQLAAIVQATAVGVVSISRDGIITTWNQGAQKLLGYRPEEIIGRRLESIVPEDRRRELRFLNGSAKQDMHYDTEAVHRNGKLIDASVTRSPMRDQAGTLIGFSILYQDASEQKRRENEMKTTLRAEQDVVDRLRDQDQMKDLLLTAASHDMRGPIATILGMALTLQRIAEFEPDTDGAKLLERIIAGAERLGRLLSDLLDLERIARGVLEWNRVETELGDLAARVVSAVTADRSIRVVGNNVRATVDPLFVERILENLVTNAVKFTPATEEIVVEVQAQDDGALIAVNDRGPGVPDRLKAEIFEPFQRGNLSPDGTGIGLTLVKRFAEVHSGRAWVEDRPGGGASFKVLLPFGPSGD